MIKIEQYQNFKLSLLAPNPNNPKIHTVQKIIGGLVTAFDIFLLSELKNVVKRIDDELNSAPMIF